MKISLVFILLLIVFLGIIHGCRKSELPPKCDPFPCNSKLELIPISDTCFELLPNTIFGFPPSYWGQDQLYRYAAFDPESYERFLFFHENDEANQTVFAPIKGANFCSGDIWTIMDSIQFTTSISRLPKWSEKGWILMVRKEAYPEERGLYKIKSDGDSLTFLLKGDGIYYPAWVENGNSLLVVLDDNNNSSIILNKNGTYKDTLNYIFSNSSEFQSKIAAIHHLLGQKDLVVFQDGEITWDYPYPEEFQNFKGLDWLNEEELVWINDSGIYRVNTLTSQVELVKEVCPNIRYTSVSAARDGSNRLLLTRDEYLFENGITDSMSQRVNIVLYDLDTGEEFYVKLGEM